jgi:hypothetical protein
MQFRWSWCVVPRCMLLSHTSFLGVNKVEPCGFVVVYEHSLCILPPCFQVHCIATIQHSASPKWKLQLRARLARHCFFFSSFPPSAVSVFIYLCNFVTLLSPPLLIPVNKNYVLNDLDWLRLDASASTGNINRELSCRERNFSWIFSFFPRKCWSKTLNNTQFQEFCLLGYNIM